MSKAPNIETDAFLLQHLSNGMLKQLEQQVARDRSAGHLDTECRALLSRAGRTTLHLMLNPLEQILAGTFGDLAPALRAELERLQERGTYLQQVIEQVDAVAQAERLAVPPDVHARDLVAFLRALLRHFEDAAAQRQVRLSMQAEVERLVLPFSRSILSKALSHLIAFALARTPRGGAVQVVVEPSGFFEAPYTTVTIRDTGPLISTSERAFIGGGSCPAEQDDDLADLDQALLLLVGRHLVVRSGLTLLVDREPEGGMVVSLRLPKPQVAAPDSPEGDPAEQENGYFEEDLFALRGLFEGTGPSTSPADDDAVPSVLLVHGSREMRASLRTYLQPYRVLEARDGSEALRRIRRERPNLIVCSLALPGGGGASLLRQLKADPQFAGIPFIVLSNAMSEDRKVRLLNAGAVAYLVEPFRMAELRATIRNLLAMEQREMEMRALAQQAQLAMLRYQLNPHFLFNALNAIRALVISDGTRARQMVTALSEYLRFSLSTANDLEVSLQEEVASVVGYLEIEKIRFEEDLDIELDIQPDALSCKVPGILLQPLVENAVKYGMATSPMPMHLRILGHKQDERLYLEVANTGRWQPSDRAEPAGTGIGLTNLRRRLVQYYPSRHRFEIKEQDGWVKAAITIELKKKISHKPATR